MEQMMTRKQPVFLAAAILGFAALAASSETSLAQSIPVPTPAPQAKTGQVPPPPSALAQQRPPAAIPSAPAANNAAPGGKATIIGNKENAGGGFDAKQRALADRISAYLSGVRTMVGDFVQVGPDGSKTQGQVYLQKPGRVRFEYADPSPIELIADGSSVVVRDRKLATQDLYPLSQTPLRFLLADKMDLLRDTNVIGIYSDDIFSTVVIEEKHAIAGTHKLMLMFGAQDLTLRQWTVTDPQGFDTTVAVYNLDTTKKPDPGLFKINYERVLQ
jgi:outer membrane lipoprotein-sorting protein